MPPMIAMIAKTYKPYLISMHKYHNTASVLEEATETFINVCQLLRKSILRMLPLDRLILTDINESLGTFYLTRRRICRIFAKIQYKSKT